MSPAPAPKQNCHAGHSGSRQHVAAARISHPGPAQATGLSLPTQIKAEARHKFAALAAVRDVSTATALRQRPAPGHSGDGLQCLQSAGWGKRAHLNEKKRTLGTLPAFSLPIVLPAWFLLSPGQFYVSKVHKFLFFQWAGGALWAAPLPAGLCVRVAQLLCAAPDYAQPHSDRPRPRGPTEDSSGAGFPGGAKRRAGDSGFQTEPAGLRVTCVCVLAEVCSRACSASLVGLKAELQPVAQRVWELTGLICQIQSTSNLRLLRGKCMGRWWRHSQAAALQASIIQTEVEITPCTHAIRASLTWW